ncbi:MAG: Rdx family protein [Myxococcales bacterium]|nr:Rdx family protein [Myxococcales bacterium]MCH8890382.1 Rdx family protein [Myxococcales bacterium]
MAATIKSEIGVESEFVCGGGGIFDVVVDGEMIFSKHESGRFPEDDEILSKIRSI